MKSCLFKLSCNVLTQYVLTALHISVCACQLHINKCTVLCIGVLFFHQSKYKTTLDSNRTVVQLIQKNHSEFAMKFTTFGVRIFVFMLVLHCSRQKQGLRQPTVHSTDRKPLSSLFGSQTDAFLRGEKNLLLPLLADKVRVALRVQAAFCPRF